MVTESLGPRAQQLQAILKTFNEEHNSTMQVVASSPARATPTGVVAGRGSTPTPRRSLSRTLCRPDCETFGSPVNLEHEIDATVMMSCAEMEQDHESLDVSAVSVRARSCNQLNPRCMRSSGCWLRAMQVATRRTGLRMQSFKTVRCRCPGTSCDDNNVWDLPCEPRGLGPQPEAHGTLWVQHWNIC